MENLYMVKNSKDEYWDFSTFHDGFDKLYKTGCPVTVSQNEAKNTAHIHGGHVITLVKEDFAKKEQVDKQYAVYKNLPGNQIVQAYKMRKLNGMDYALAYYVFDASDVAYNSNFCFTDEEIEQYGLQNFVKEQVEDD